MQTGNIKTSLIEFHYPELSKWLALLYPKAFRKFLKSSSAVSSVVYGEYRAALQVELLGINTAYIKQPVLDIGCGSQANLVTYFRTQGIEAYGIDRQLEKGEPFLRQVDWFDFEPGGWGTIISHMSFTNHLNYAYLHDASQLEQYLLTMKRIFESLSIEGTFHYAPGLPFMEDQLPRTRYKVKCERKIRNVSVSSVVRIA